ncbi:MAG: LacI family DNA-binding transcriptional regulator [Candidatus Eremiobacteraeota bacterium]|nr:LacI family DNA-binding transcriptional regulator [Candidatus Eremiobacteraeota bacterium]MBV8644895.1 LacI family DNA-binding transcriptional regulator [Candidatus Eremiobacteraeota bacterium]
MSVATASRAISPSGHAVSHALRQRVLQAAAELDYAGDAAARDVRASRSRVIGVVVADVLDSFTAFMRAIDDAAHENGWLITVGNARREPEREFRLIREFRAQRVGALILAGSGFDDVDYVERLEAELEPYRKARGRIVLTGRRDLRDNLVVPDNVGGAKRATEHLLDLGHRRIGVLAGPPLLAGSNDRLDGVRDALAERGLTLDPVLVEHTDGRRSGGERVIELLRRAPDLTAVFALTDDAALGALDVLHENGIRVPSDISLVGFDDSPFASAAVPSLTTVRSNMTLMARRAVEVAIGNGAAPAVTEVVPTELVVRASTARRPRDRRG